MASNELVDLSLFAESPTVDHHFSVSCEARPQHYEFYAPSRYRSHTVPNDYTNKPLPPLPHRRLCRPIARVSGCEPDSRCILKRIQRIGSNEQPPTQADSLLQRRNPLSPPALTLSVPSSQPWNRNPASAMVWMPDEQMWLVAGEERREEANQSIYQTAYPSPPSYTPRPITRSEPSPTIPPPFDLSPPLTPIQHQLQSLIQPPTERDEEPSSPFFPESINQRDEERFSPLFQEAMNSVPMLDPRELFLPSLTLNTNVGPEQSGPISQLLRPQSAVERPTSSDLSSPLGARRTPLRSASAASRVSHARSDTSESRSYYSAMSVDLTRPEHSASRWAGLARRVATSPESVTG